MAKLNFIKNTKAAEDEQLIWTYQSHMEIQMWAYLSTHPNSEFSVLILSRISSNLDAKYCIVVKQVYKYLNSTKDYKLVYWRGHQDFFKLKFTLIPIG